MLRINALPPSSGLINKAKVRKNDPGIGKVKEECNGRISTLDLSRLSVKGDSTLLRNDGICLQNYTTLYPTRQQFS